MGQENISVLTEWNLKKIKNAIFDYNVDVFAVSLDGATDETNSRIRRGSKIDVICDDLRDIVRIKKKEDLHIHG